MINDTTRCHDTRCEVREHCRRWRDRESGGVQVVHAMTVRPAWQCHALPCSNALGDFPEEPEQR